MHNINTPGIRIKTVIAVIIKYFSQKDDPESQSRGQGNDTCNSVFSLSEQGTNCQPESVHEISFLWITITKRHE
jgi:hypothetical protein